MLETRARPSHAGRVELPALNVRRATVEDLPALQVLWQQADLPWMELERFATEFQVVLAKDAKESSATFSVIRRMLDRVMLSMTEIRGKATTDMISVLS